MRPTVVKGKSVGARPSSDGAMFRIEHDVPTSFPMDAGRLQALHQTPMEGHSPG